ncbi:hypothetical protein RND81_09G011200 [Saponaria officinalis]|uniref:Uncharacterized protein n=1 Tax=Saponaria officinalis TaxID=3572 RepID=A0AAW1IG06_SAPOF
MGWKQIFHLPEEMRFQLAQALQNPEPYTEQVKNAGEPVEQSAKCMSCSTALSFSDEDLLLGSELHNRPLYVSGYIRGQKVSRILIDGGSGVNLMPKTTMKELGITMDKLSSRQTMIHGFNLNGERALGIIRVNLTIDDLSSDTLLHIIDIKTSFKLLLGRPWKHENGVVASTLHQSLKYYRRGERKINGDVKPFTKAGSFFADAKIFEKNDISSEFLPVTISSTGKKYKGYIPPITTVDDNSPHIEKKDEVKIESKPRSTASAVKQEEAQKTSSPILGLMPLLTARR